MKTKPLMSLTCLLLLSTSLACDRPERVKDPTVTEPTVTEPTVTEPVAVERFGDVDFQTSCNEQAQAHFEAGLGLLHHMWYSRANETFANAAEADPQCAMAHWGLAMTHYTPLWAPPSEQDLQQGTRAIERARELEATERERAFIAAAAAFYEGEDVPLQARAEAFREGWEQVHVQAPGDIEAASFYALSILATAPVITETHEEHQTAGAILERVLQQEPNHPGGHHYLLHAYDSAALAERALPVARAYSDIAPSVPHALHMPSHIFVRLGMWEENNEWNLRSAEAAEQHAVNDRVPMDFYHALDYVAYGYLQQGRDDLAASIAERTRAVENPHHHIASGYASVAIPARIAIEQRDWEAAANLEHLHPQLSLQDWPQVLAVLHAVRATGAIFHNDLETAGQEYARLEELNTIMVDIDDPHWTPHVQAYQGLVSALLRYAGGDTDIAIEQMRQVTAFQDSFDKHPIMPGRTLEAGEFLGMLLRMDGQHQAALQAYENALEMTPNRFHLYYGAAVSAQLADQPQVARRYYAMLLQLASDDEVDRREVEEAREFLDRAKVGARER